MSQQAFFVQNQKTQFRICKNSTLVKPVPSPLILTSERLRVKFLGKYYLRLHNIVAAPISQYWLGILKIGLDLQKGLELS